MRVSQQLPHGREAAGQKGQGAQVGVAFGGAVKVAAARRSQAKFLGGFGVFDILGGGVAAGDHLGGAATVGLEFGEQRILFSGRKFVAARVRYHGHATRIGDPVHGVAQAGPAGGHIAGVAFGEVFAKHLVGFFAHAGFDQKAGKVGARDQLGVAHKLERAFVGTVDAHFGQLGRHFLGPLAAPAARGLQAGVHAGAVGIKAQAHNVHGFVGKGDGYFGAREVLHALRVAAAAARCWPPISSWSVSAHSSTPLVLARSARASGVRVPSETTLWQCRSALRIDFAVTRVFYVLANNWVAQAARAARRCRSRRIHPWPGLLLKLSFSPINYCRSSYNLYSNFASIWVICAAGIAWHPVVFCPLHRGLKSPRPNFSAATRKGAMAAVAVGKAGALGHSGPSPCITRLTMPRAGRPVNRVVSAVCCAAGLCNAARWMVLVVASGHSR